MNMMTEITRQHLIDPEICIRCNTCEENCPKNAIVHDTRNYVVKAEICDNCMTCVQNCPTGAVDAWRFIGGQEPYTIEDQFTWNKLPEDTQPTQSPAHHAAPASAPKPVVNLFTARAPATATVTTNVRITAADASSDIHHIVIDLGSHHYPVLEGQSVGILPPGTDTEGSPHQMRVYSIASPRDGEGGRGTAIALTVKRVTQDHEGRPVRGICSNYLCDLPPGHQVQVVGPFGANFLMPDDPAASIVMMCTGTGIAPMRAMIERRKTVAGTGKMSLYYGGRTPGELPYLAELQALPASAVDLNIAFSRVANQPKTYIQDLMRRRSADIAARLQDETSYFYMCGLKGMERGILDAFRDICTEHGLDWDPLHARMQHDARLHVETY